VLLVFIALLLKCDNFWYTNSVWTFVILPNGGSYTSVGLSNVCYWCRKRKVQNFGVKTFKNKKKFDIALIFLFYKNPCFIEKVFPSQ
jgi:hypothetical protein